MIDCAVIGGGVAGLAAAVRFAEQGLSVILIEGRPKCGGRAYSYTDIDTGETLDNGQHILMGCYTATLNFLRTIGAESKLTRIRRLRIPFYHADGRHAVLGMKPLPHPLGPLSALMTFGMLSGKERVAVGRAALALKRLKPAQADELDSISVEEWLRRLDQPPNTMECLWEPIVLATMNTHAADASAKLFAVVMKEAFLGAKNATDFLIPSVGLSELYVDDALAFLAKRNARVVLHDPVVSIHKPGGEFILTTKNGEELRAKRTVAAIPPWALKTLVSNSPDFSSLHVEWDRFTPSEITSVQIVLSQPLTEELMTGLLGTTLHWLFFKGRTPQGGWRYAGVISGANALQGVDNGDLSATIRNELASVFPSFKQADILHWKIVREKSATFVPAPGLESLRPRSATAIHGFYLAGDWVGTGLPATIEGAARSAHGLS